MISESEWRLTISPKEKSTASVLRSRSIFNSFAISGTPWSFLQNGLSEVDYSWAGRGEPGCVRSGRGGPVVDDANDLIDGERDDAEHVMAFDLERAADAEKSGAELVFQTGVDAFGHGAEIVDQVVEVGHVDELQALDL